MHGTLGLDILAAKIREHHKAVGAAIVHAIKAGQLLLEAKRKVGHGNWLPWLEANCEMSERTAQNYMRIAKVLGGLNDEAKAQRLADLCWRDMGAVDAISLRDIVSDNPDLVSKAYGPDCNGRDPRSFTPNSFLQMLRKSNDAWMGWGEKARGPGDVFARTPEEAEARRQKHHDEPKTDTMISAASDLQTMIGSLSRYRRENYARKVLAARQIDIADIDRAAEGLAMLRKVIAG